MPGIDIEIRGLNELYERLGNAVAAETLIPPMQRALYDMQNRMSLYPDTLPNQVYVRTGTLGREWTAAQAEINEVTGGVTGRVGTVTEYAPWVQKADQQAAIHQGRWPTAEQQLEDAMPTIVADFEGAINAALEGR
jgi:hypothetical protein